MAKKKSKALSLVALPVGDVAASGSSIQGTNLSSPVSLPVGSHLGSGSSASVHAAFATGHGSPSGSAHPAVETAPSDFQSSGFQSSPPLPSAVHPQSGLAGSAQPSSKPEDVVTPLAKNYADLLKSTAKLKEIGTPIEHVSGAPFVLIPDENIEAAKLEFKDFIYARFHGDYPAMGKIIGVVNAIWAKTGPRISVHNIGQGMYLLRVTNQRTREVLLSRTCWNIAGLPMFVAPWSPDYSQDEPPLTSAIVPVELRNVPYLLFNQESLSRLATAVGKPDSLAPETERKLNFEVAKLYVRVDLTAPLPNKIVSGFSNGREVVIDVSYPWLPVKCDRCNKFGHSSIKCTLGVAEGGFASKSVRKVTTETSRRRSKSRTGRATARKDAHGAPQYVPVVRNSHEEAKVAGVNDAQKISTLQQGNETDLEEGEIYQQVLEIMVISGKFDDAAGISSTPTAAITDILSSSSEGCGKDKWVSDPALDILDAPPAAVSVLVIESKGTVDDKIASTSTTIKTDSYAAVVGVGVESKINSSQKEESSNHRNKAQDQEQEKPFILVKNRRTIPRGWQFFGNYDADDSGRIVIVWDPRVILVIYDATAQSVTCGISVLSENISLTVTFVYGFNQVEDRRCLWHNLVNLQSSSPVSFSPWSDANLGLQDAQLFEAQANGLPFTWRNSQDDNPISTRIDHAFINQAWLTSFPDSYADFLDPSQSDHAPCLFRVPSIRRQIIKPFKFFHHVIDHPEYAGTVSGAWNCTRITGTDQFKLIRSLKLLKRPLCQLNKRHFSGITQRVKDQKEKVDVLQRSLLTSPDVATAREEHSERDKLSVLLKAEEKFFRQRSRVRWADVGDRNTPFYHRTVSSHASRNHIHYLTDGEDRFYYTMEEIKSHAADYFQGILGCTDLPSSPASNVELCVMNHFKEWSGLDTNESKSEIFYGGYSETQAAVLSDLSGFRRGEFPTRYLGLPLSPKKISAATLQPFIDRITSKLHSWTVKFLSFAGKVMMISSVIYGMVNFWSSVFVLPKWFYAKVDSLCSGFLWKNSTISAAGARVSWGNICKPKSEGGLGIRHLEEFEMVFRLKRVWLFFYGSGSLWVPWLINNRFGGRSFWLINDSPRFSRTVRSMLQLRQELHLFLRCNVGNGIIASFWYDFWTELGPLHIMFGPLGPRTLRIPISATVSQAVSNGNWNLPPARSENAETLQIVLSTLSIPSADNGFGLSFSSRDTWDRIRVPRPLVNWHSVVWFKEKIPRCSFITWTAYLGRLPTRDRLISWGLSVPPGSALMVMCQQMQGPHALRAVVVLKLLNQVIIYSLWRERNARIFRSESSSPEVFFRVVDRALRDRLLSLSRPSASVQAPSLLELYFWFLSPFS
ncbi:hypothetical protein Bca52824_025888 [Brassica carinata]|uniref:DUF4283 domain-containing protein n=1 Tax=Brassica carinata TaxID=52824 RepID=A0A8X7SGG1_BRACI|nr:hypothetical protein Bca52824_025888 [Brassica carinata]